MRAGFLLAPAFLAGCTPSGEAPDPGPEQVAPQAPAAAWRGSVGAEGAVLVLAGERGARTLTLLCPSGTRDLLVNVPAFRPVGSEERMSFGAGGTVVTLVADTRGDRTRGGVSGRGPRPPELAAILEGPLAVNYGAQNSGPHMPPPPRLAADFLVGCRG